ncbi:MAG: MFS transporter [Candidatus Lokiarchaeota archaeon]|nr:MFS transporter [Candidatus Lokiarchaeota archaeon]MBD3340291.1 MFS transporter [Candidatus Lokiarchaeota archaeon]
MAEKLKKYSHSRFTYISYGLGGFVDNFFTAAFTVRIIDFYENELLLAIFWVGLAFAIYGFWNMINDPILGWISDKKFNFTKRWGRRFPFFAAGALSFVWMYLFIFTVPFTDQVGIFIWLLITICAFELLYSLFIVNYISLFPHKFRTMQERTRAGAQNTAWGVLGIALGVLVPPLIIVYGDLSSYIIAALVVSVIGFLIALLSLHGMREDEELIERQLKTIEQQGEKESFFQILKYALKDKNYVVYILVSLGHAVLTVMILSSLPYWNKYIIGSSDPELETYISAGFLVAVLISVPIWGFIGRKVGNKRAITYGTLLTTILFIPLFFVNDLISSIIFIALIGFGIGCFWILMFPCFSDVVDNIVIQTSKRQEGALSGVRIFTERLSIIIQAVAFALIHPLTGYKAGAPPGKTSQTLLAQFGIRLLMVGIPMAFYFLAFLLIWRIYTLDKACVSDNTVLLEQRAL